MEDLLSVLGNWTFAGARRSKHPLRDLGKEGKRLDRKLYAIHNPTTSISFVKSICSRARLDRYTA
jgi:hypothetical protein